MEFGNSEVMRVRGQYFVVFVLVFHLMAKIAPKDALK